MTCVLDNDLSRVGDNVTPMTRLMSFTDRFITHERTRGYSEQTIRRRVSTLERFEEFIGGDVRHGSAEHVEGFIGRHDVAETRRAYLNDLKRIYRWAVRNGYVDTDPTACLETIRVPKRAPTPLHRGDVPKLRAACRTDQERLTVELGLCAGLRCGEMAALDSNDIDTIARIIAVRGGKGNKDRTVPLAASLTQWLPSTPGPLLTARSANAVSNRLRNILDRAGLTQHRPHDLRATFATELARASNGNVSLVATLLGHASLATAQRYIAFNPLGADVVDMLHAA